MFNLSSQKHECTSSIQEGQVPSSASQGKGWQGTSYGLGRDGFHRKRCSDVGPDYTAKQPSGVTRDQPVLPYEWRGRPPFTGT
jgi:hypothetical protein